MTQEKTAPEVLRILTGMLRDRLAAMDDEAADARHLLDEIEAVSGKAPLVVARPRRDKRWTR